MESEDTIILDPEDYQDYHRLAAKLFGRDPTKPGRPSKDETEFREFLKDFENYRRLKELGIYDKFFSELRSSDRDTGEREVRSRRSSKGKRKSIFGGFLGLDLESFTKETTQETIKEGLVKYGPLVGLLAALWTAEEFIKIPTKDKVKKQKEVRYIKDYVWVEGGPGHPRTKQPVWDTKTIEVEETVMQPFPPFLHAFVSILLILAQALTAVTKLFEVLGGFDLGDMLVGQKGDKKLSLIEVLDIMVRRHRVLYDEEPPW
ncbi:MAG: hypothetical protein JRI72_06705 [Deltaproteobacteria bacterium]|nr:hypothetical protein [Deltaproteobacteria bacterium]